MPSGASVTAEYGVYRPGDIHLDVRVYPLAEDFENSEGLCGNWNNNPNDDLTSRGTTMVDGNANEPVEFAKSYM